MRFTVTSLPAAQDTLALIWMTATDRNAVSQASNRIDAILKRDPLSRGESRRNYRALIVEPLTVHYTVSLDDRVVTILDFIHQG